MTAKLRTASDVQRAKNLIYQQNIEDQVLSDQDKTWLDDYHEGIRSQQDATLRATEVKKKSATANATGIMSMEVACLFPTQCIARYTEGLYEVQGNTSIRALQRPLSHRV